MFDPTNERWPPTYDFEELARQIGELAGSEGIEHGFYESSGSASNRSGTPEWCQGDVLHLECDVPLIDEDGQPAAVESDLLWLIIGNTCDIERELNEAKWTQLVPLVDVGDKTEVSRDELATLRRYSQFRRFYVPPWTPTENHYVADFLRPVAIHKAALARATRVARMGVRGWILLHSCLVRFLARDDGRHD